MRNNSTVDKPRSFKSGDSGSIHLMPFLLGNLDTVEAINNETLFNKVSNRNNLFFQYHVFIVFNPKI